jgi:IMP cyclohydrolase
VWGERKSFNYFETQPKMVKGYKMNPYEINNIGKILKNKTYLGRGLVIGQSENGNQAVFAYFITGRSENSRNRIFLESKNEVIIQPCDMSKVKNADLIVYSPVKKIKNNIVVTNGDQTNTICDFVKNGKTFEEALETRKFEPDPPNFTPRISGIITLDGSTFKYKISILKSMDENGTYCSQYTYKYFPIPSLGHFIHTYIDDGNPLPPFCGEPLRIKIPNNIDDFTNIIWDNLYDQNKISLYVQYINIKDQKYESRLLNKNKIQSL